MTGSLAGAVVGARYRLTSRIAIGGMGEVWRGVDELLGRDVAVKILRTELADDDAFVRRFREEARTAGGLTHPGIAAVFDYGESAPARTGAQGTPESTVSYLVMELVPGEPLSSLLADGEGLDPRRTLIYLAQAARALHAAHLKGVIHRDVKPANLLVTPDDRLKITDFGIARPQDHEPLTATGQVMGTAHYLAPELARGHPATAQSDIYALGVVMYECLAGRRPFEGDNQVAVATAHLAEEPPPLSPSLAADVRGLVSRAMAKDSNLRYASALDYALAMEDVVRGIDRLNPQPVELPTSTLPVTGAHDGSLSGFDAALRGPGDGQHLSGPISLPTPVRTPTPSWGHQAEPSRAATPGISTGPPLQRPRRIEPPGRQVALPTLILVGLAIVLVLGIVVSSLVFGGKKPASADPSNSVAATVSTPATPSTRPTRSVLTNTIKIIPSTRKAATNPSMHPTSATASSSSPVPTGTPSGSGTGGGGTSSTPSTSAASAS